MNQGVVWPAPAKLNLMLHITGRRTDGYHDLQTVFQFLDLCDELQFKVTTNKAITRRQGPSFIAAKDDLVVRSARELQRISGTFRGVEIRINKHIPVGAGLGGGSSDAATTLHALNRLWGLNLERDTLAGLGLQLGADVPVFIHGQAAWGEGVGEILTPVTLPQAWYLVVIPAISVSTADIFSDAELTRDTPRMTIRDFLSGGGQNDCEAVVRRRYPEVSAALDWLSGFSPARMTGTGGCVFAAFGSEAEARSVERVLPPVWSCLVARGLNRSPLLTAAPDR